MTEGEVMEAVIFGLYLDLKNMTWSGKSQGIFYYLSAGNPDVPLI